MFKMYLLLSMLFCGTQIPDLEALEGEFSMTKLNKDDGYSLKTTKSVTIKISF